MTEILTVERRDAVDYVTLNRPERLNALSVEMVTSLTKVVRGSVGSGVRALVLRGKRQPAQVMRSLEEILAHADEQTPKRRENLATHREDAFRSRELGTIVRDIPELADFDPGAVIDAPPDRSKLAYGVSVTDACIGWEETEELLVEAQGRLG